MCSNSAPGTFLKHDNTCRVGNLDCVTSCASFGQWWYVFATLVVWAYAMYPLFVGLLMISVMCSMTICVALSFIGAYPSPISLVGLCIASIGKLGKCPSASLAALSRILSIVSSYLSAKIPRWVAWYFDLSSCSITSFFSVG